MSLFSTGGETMNGHKEEREQTGNKGQSYRLATPAELEKFENLAEKRQAKEDKKTLIGIGYLYLVLFLFMLVVPFGLFQCNRERDVDREYWGDYQDGYYDRGDY